MGACSAQAGVRAGRTAGLLQLCVRSGRGLLWCRMQLSLAQPSVTVATYDTAVGWTGRQAQAAHGQHPRTVPLIPPNHQAQRSPATQACGGSGGERRRAGMRSLQLAALAAVGFGGPLWAASLISDPRVQQLLAACAVVSVLGFFGTLYLVPLVASKTQSRGICGKDLNKKGTPAGEVPIPESAGLAPGCVFLLCVISFELLHYYDIGSLLDFVRNGFTGTLLTEPIAEAWLVDYNAALATIGFMLFLGFADDVLDIRWRVKLILPFFASLPLLVAYSGGTGVAVPKPLQGFGLPAYLELGILYKVRCATLDGK
jgi:hypothetical protein